MRDWSSLSVNFVHWSMATLNGALGLLNLHRHSYFAASFSFGSAVFIIALNIAYRLRHGHLVRLRARLAELRQEMTDMTPEEWEKAEQLARANLTRVAILTGATVRANWINADIKIGEYNYIVGSGGIRRWQVNSETGYRASEETCLQISCAMPHPERIASVLLLLKNDPTIFDRWSRHDNYYA